MRVMALQCEAVAQEEWRGTVQEGQLSVEK